MKRARPLWIGVATAAAILLVVVAIGFNASFQTWAVHRWIKAHPDVHVTVGRVSAGWHHVELSDVHFDRDGRSVTVPRLDADLSLATLLLHREIVVSKLIADGFVVQMPEAPRPLTGSARATDTKTALPPSARGDDAAAVAPKFRGVFPLIDLPIGATVDELRVSGVVRRSNAEMTVTIVGSGIAAGKTANFTVTSRTTLRDAEVATITTQAKVAARMDSPRTFADIETTTDATAEGAKLARPVVLHAEMGAQRSARAEHYVIRVRGADRELASVVADYTAGESRISGNWKLDVRDADVSAFTLGHAIPAFVATGAGTVDTDADWSAVHVMGKLDATLDRLGAVNATLSEVGAIKLTADVDLAQRGSVFTVSKLSAEFAGTPATVAGANAGAATKNVASLRALQAFEFNAATGEVKAGNAATDLVGIDLRAVPLAWARPFLDGFAVEGSDVRGEFTATPRAGGLTFRSKTPLTVSHLAIAQGSQPLIRDLDLSLHVSGDYTPSGWQVELNGLTARNGASSVLLVDAKAGRLSAPNQPIKATGLISADLAVLLAQPIAQGALAVKRGDATIEFAASIGATKEIQANIGIKNLVPAQTPAPQALPAITATVRADVAQNGRVTLSAPIKVQQDGRVTDCTVAGAVERINDGIRFDAELTSNTIVVQDIQALGAVVVPRASDTPGRTPPWAGLAGTIALQVKRVVYANTYQVGNVVGTLRLQDGSLRFEGLRAAVGEGGEARAAGVVSFESEAAEPYVLAGDIALTDVDPGPFFIAVNPRQPPTVEGRFTITSRVAARARALSQLPHAAVGDFEFTSRAGVFRGIPVNVGNLVENSSKLRAWLAAAGDVITAPFMGTKDQDEITSRSQAANELAKILSSIPYDQLAIVISRPDYAQAEVKELTLISPELRINGSGVLRRGIGPSLLSDVVDVELHLRARGRTAELMKYLGILDPKPDDLGYAACTIPVHVDGALDRLDTTQLNNRLVALAVVKTGITEKAVDWINRLRGKSAN